MARPKKRVKTNRDRQREETHRRIFDASIQVFRKLGVVDARVADITELAQVSHGSFYFHFDTKEDVVVELLRKSEAHIDGSLSDLGDQAPITAVFSRYCEAMGEVWHDDPRLFSYVGMLALRLLASNEEEFRRPIRTTLTAHMLRAQEAGTIKAIIPADVLADIFLVNTFAAAMAWSNQPTLSLKVLLQNVVQIFLDGAGGFQESIAFQSL